MPLETCSVTGIKVSAADAGGLIEELARLRQARQGAVVLCLNAHISNLSADNPRLAAALNAAAFVGADGISIVWAARLLGCRIPGRCNMTDAFRTYLQVPAAMPAKALLVGCKPDVARRAADRINQESPHCRIARWMHGYGSDAEYAAFFQANADADLVLLGMGTPRSELLAALAQQHCPHAVVWHIGGGTIQFYAGTLVEAPAWMGRVGLQWLHRLLIEPRRMWKRYLLGNPRFCFRVLKQILRG